ncbi:MAG: hypothetical protein ACLTKG_02445 [Collinsella intestinalis]
MGNDNATLKYAIKAGQPYMIVANYEANRDAELVVTYHVQRGDALTTVDVVKRAGATLGAGPEAGFEVKDAVFLGWTEQQPAQGDYLMFDAADPNQMVSKGTIVTRSMELWAVYLPITTGGEGDKADVCEFEHRCRASRPGQSSPRDGEDGRHFAGKADLRGPGG